MALPDATLADKVQSNIPLTFLIGRLITSPIDLNPFVPLKPDSPPFSGMPDRMWVKRLKLISYASISSVAGECYAILSGSP